MIKKLRNQPYAPKWEQVPKWEHRGRKKKPFRPHYGPEVDSASNRNEYQKSSWGLRPEACKVDNLTANCERAV
jgi:hypothetical protein